MFLAEVTLKGLLFTEDAGQLATFSMFGLMLFPDRRKGFAEIHRTLKPGRHDDEWRQKEILALNYLEEKIPSTPSSLTSDAWLGLGVK